MGAIRTRAREILRRSKRNKRIRDLIKVSKMSGVEKAMYYRSRGHLPQVHYKKRSIWQKIKRAFRKLFTFRKW